MKKHRTFGSLIYRPRSADAEVCRDSTTVLPPDDLHEHPLGPMSVEFAVEDLFPGTEVKFTLGDGDNNLPAHDLPFQVGVGVVLAGSVVMVMVGIGIERSELFQPDSEIVVEAALIVIDENGACDVH
jgi:hypothetical protein